MFFRLFRNAAGLKHEAGFSLIELTIIVFIIGVMAAIVIPGSTPGNQKKLDLAAQEFAMAMRFARSEAIRLGEPRGFHQQSGQKRIRVFRADTATSPWTPNYDVYHPVSKKLYDIDLNTHTTAGADSLAHNPVYRGTCNQPAKVYFDANGVPHCLDPSTVLLQQFDVTFTLGSHSRVLRLDSISGRVSIQ